MLGLQIYASFAAIFLMRQGQLSKASHLVCGQVLSKLIVGVICANDNIKYANYATQFCSELTIQAVKQW